MEILVLLSNMKRNDFFEEMLPRVVVTEIMFLWRVVVMSAAGSSQPFLSSVRLPCRKPC